MCDSGIIKSFDGSGRSFYLCSKCIQEGEKKIKRPLSRICKKEIKLKDLEKIVNG